MGNIKKAILGVVSAAALIVPLVTYASDANVQSGTDYQNYGRHHRYMHSEMPRHYGINRADRVYGHCCYLDGVEFDTEFNEEIENTEFRHHHNRGGHMRGRHMRRGVSEYNRNGRHMR